MQDNLSLSEVQKEWHGTLRHYVIGFVLSLFLSGVAFALVMAEVIKGTTIIYILAGLAIVQAIGQIIYFLHIGKEEKPRWETGLLLFMAMVVVIIVVGSLWIMFDLNKRTMEEMSHERLSPQTGEERVTEKELQLHESVNPPRNRPIEAKIAQ